MKKKLLGIAAALVVLGLVLFALPTPGEPDLVCVADGAPSSGFVDDDQDGCPVSTESYEEYSDWESSPKIDNIAGLVLIAGAVVLAGVAMFRKSDPASS